MVHGRQPLERHRLSRRLPAVGAAGTSTGAGLHAHHGWGRQPIGMLLPEARIALHAWLLTWFDRRDVG
jgi:hypothetical protein